jgi:hypothetical protein
MDWMATFPLLHRFASELRSRGVGVELDHFYGPIPNLAELPADHFQRRSELPGVEMRLQDQLAWVKEWDALAGELDALPAGSPEGPPRFSHDNPFFAGADANVLYALLRTQRPSRMVEVGSGQSTLLSAQALARNSKEGSRCRFTAYEPFPAEYLRAGPIEGLDELVSLPAQRIPPEAFEELTAGDVLFIDSSHVLKTGSDVQSLYLEVIPRLAKGVWVHIHDIFFPLEYPEPWVRQEHRFWTEQYLLQAFLAFNAAWQVEWCGSWRQQERPERAPARFRGGGSFWMRRAAGAA